MPADLASYLASRYLVADPKPHSKKRKRKQQPGTHGIVIQDDDDMSWRQAGTAAAHGEESPLTVAGSTSAFRKPSKSSWKTVGTSEVDTEAAAADAVLASTAVENESRRPVDEEMPVIDNKNELVMMSDGTHAGLQTAAAVSAQLKQRQKEEAEDFEHHKRSVNEEETVYRDATGRRIDVSMKRAEARKAALAAEDKARLAKQALRGTVQAGEAQKRKQQLEDAKFLPFSRTVDDEELNKELMEQERWNDPMLQFIEEKKDARSQKSVTQRRPMYVGASPPNRYGIKPGYRWDGVDRGIGFEAERFRAINRRQRNKGLDYSWQMDE